MLDFRKAWSKLSLLTFLAIVSLSCVSRRNITYFRDVTDSIGGLPISLEVAEFVDPVIKPSDILHISVQTLDAPSTSIMGVNTSSTFSTSSSTVQPNVLGYLVDRFGGIEVPLVGRVEVGGLTTSQAKEVIRQRATVFYKDPVVNVRFANFEITVLGEVNNPAKYLAPSERVSVLDALGMAGDLTVYGKRENVMLIRDINGIKQVVRFNLNSTQTFKSPFFYLKQGDVLYVEADKSKLATTDAARTRTYTLIISAVSALLVILTRFNF